ncbi:MAG: DUF4359 domain-containing protein [Methylococcales bacterium]
MKLIISIIALIGIIILLTVTNPKLETYEQFVDQQIKIETRKQQDPLANVIGSLFSGLATNFVIQQTVRQDFVLFSTYDTQFDDEHLKVIGLLNNFFITEKPGFVNKNFQ